MSWINRSLAITGATTASYLVLYTGYSKEKKALDPSLLADVLLARRGPKFSIMEFNKLISLVGISTLMLALCPGMEKEQADLTIHSIITLSVHSLLSSYLFYGKANIPPVQEFPSMPMDLVSKDPKQLGKGLKKLAILAGALCHLTLFKGDSWFGKCVATYATIDLALLHFTTMEMKHDTSNGWSLAVRPYAYLPYALGIVGAANQMVKDFGR
mmetsp:Transcript_55100/g.120850  ORF Transcript_55100/g.120850 Transcript_55100/m.120850 type:complete len:213 (+) Transcript_55100:50-688(+)